MVLLLDVGNTDTVLGAMDGGTLRFLMRMPSDRSRTEEALCGLLSAGFREQGVDPAQVEGGILSSVVPTLGSALRRALERLTGKRMLEVSSALDLGFEVAMDDPRRVGADLLTAAAAALERYRPPIAIFDMGTATTLSVIDGAGRYVSTLIVPGLGISLEALTQRAAQLFPVKLEEPPRHFFATNTADSLRAGAIYSSAAMVDGLAQRTEAELGEPVTVVSTGGLMKLVAPCCQREVHHDRDLLLHGLWALYRRNHREQ